MFTADMQNCKELLWVHMCIFALIVCGVYAHAMDTSEMIAFARSSQSVGSMFDHIIDRFQSMDEGGCRQMLLQDVIRWCGHDLEERNSRGQTLFLRIAMDSRLSFKRKEIALKLLADYSCNVDARDRGGDTALHWASRNYRGRLVEFLARLGVDDLLENSQGRVPLDEVMRRKKVPASTTVVQYRLDQTISDLQKSWEEAANLRAALKREQHARVQLQKRCAVAERAFEAASPSKKRKREPVECIVCRCDNAEADMQFTVHPCKGKEHPGQLICQACFHTLKKNKHSCPICREKLQKTKKIHWQFVDAGEELECRKLKRQELLPID